MKPGAGGHARSGVRRVARALDVDLVIGADGARVVGARDAAPTDQPTNHADPCGGCSCCGAWHSHLAQLQRSIVAHLGHAAAAGDPTPCPDADGCLVCAVARGTW